MLNTLPFLILWFFQSAPQAVGSDIFEKILVPLILVAGTNALTFYLTRRKNDADIAKIYGETIKGYVETIGEMQDTTDDIYKNLQFLRNEKFNVDALLSSIVRTIDSVQQALSDSNHKWLIDDLANIRARIVGTKNENKEPTK